MTEPLNQPFPFDSLRNYYPDEPLINLIRHYRNYLLLSSDWTQLYDAPVNQAAWATYRQALRDFPNTYDATSEQINWPVPPT